MGFRADVFFASRWFVMVHILEIILILLIAGLVFGRLTISNPPVTRSDLLGLIMVRSPLSPHPPKKQKARNS